MKKFDSEAVDLIKKSSNLMRIMKEVENLAGKPNPKLHVTFDGSWSSSCLFLLFSSTFLTPTTDLLLVKKGLCRFLILLQIWAKSDGINNRMESTFVSTQPLLMHSINWLFHLLVLRMNMLQLFLFSHFFSVVTVQLQEIC